MLRLTVAGGHTRGLLPRRCAAPHRVSRPASTSEGSEQATAALAKAPELRNLGPEAKPLTVAKGELLNVLQAAVPILTRAGTGALVAGYRPGLAEDDSTAYSLLRLQGRRLQESSKIPSFPRPAEPLQLYEFEACPFCKKVREAVSILDLDVLVYPCPVDGKVWRPAAESAGGKSQFPYLVDPNNGRAMYESDDIVQYLFDTYGDGQVPLALRAGALTTLTCGLGNVARSGRGRAARPSQQPAQPLVLWGYEASPFVKLVREVLCELELPYLLRTCARGSAKRQELFEKRGVFAAPCLEDPNTGGYLFESAAIVKYLNDTFEI